MPLVRKTSIEKLNKTVKLKNKTTYRLRVGRDFRLLICFRLKPISECESQG